MKKFINERTYKEVWNILKEKTEIQSKLPKNILKHIYTNSQKTYYEIEYNDQKEILTQVSREAFVLYLSLYLQYIATNEEKEKLKQLLIQNEIKLKTEHRGRPLNVSFLPDNRKF